MADDFFGKFSAIVGERFAAEHAVAAPAAPPAPVPTQASAWAAPSDAAVPPAPAVHRRRRKHRLGTADQHRRAAARATDAGGPSGGVQPERPCPSSTDAVGAGRHRRSQGQPWYVWLIGLIVLVILLFWLFG